MDGHNNHPGYLQDDMSYDDLMNSGGWPASGEQYSYQPPPQQQDPYARYQQPNQPTFDQFELPQQPSYNSTPYSNSPYASQYHARPSDIYGPSSYNVVDPSLQGSAAYHGQDGSFSFAAHAIENPTIAPQSLQYNIPPNVTVNRGAPNAAYERSANGVTSFNQRPQDQAALYYSNPQNGNMQLNQPGSVRYPTLPNGPTDNESKPAPKGYVVADAASIAPRPQPVRSAPAPDPLRITKPELLAPKEGASRPHFNYAPFVTWEDTPVQVNLGLKNNIPKYHPRKSRSGKELVPGLDISLTSTPARISIKKARPPKEKKPSLSKYKGTSNGARPVSDKISNLRDDASLASVKSPSTPTETSSSEEETSSEEESEYEDDADMPLDDISTVRAETRPTSPSEAARWDAIGIVWQDRRVSVAPDTIKDAMDKYGSFVSALRQQLKTNSTKIEGAASNPSLVSQLKDERQVLLESLYQTIDAANEVGHVMIVENLGSHQKLVNGLTTTLIDCNKAEDFVGKLPKAVLKLLASFKTMTDALLTKLKFEGIQKRWNKKGDQETKDYFAAIFAKTVEARARAEKTKKEAEKAEEEKKKALEKAEQAKARNGTNAVLPTTISTKRPHEADASNGKPNKKFASDVAGAPSSLKSVPPKRTANNLLGIASKPVAKQIPKKRESSPPALSKLGAILDSIHKPAEPPKVPEQPQRPPETPEEKARRERKESRRHLRVHFPEGPELEQIRHFTHEQAEDEGRQDEMLRDAHDERNEGMMHKQRVSETIDDDDDYQPAEPEDLPYREPVKIDFSPLEKPSRFGPSFVTRGGDVTFTTPEQKVQEKREGLELMVVYTDPADIPPTPKEPPQTDGPADTQSERELKLPTDPWLVHRLHEIKQYGPENASRIFSSRYEEQNRARGIAPFKNPSPQVSSSQQLLHTPGTVNANLYNNILRLISQLKGKPYPATEPPDWMTNEAQRAGWMEGYNRDKAIKEKREVDQKMAEIQAARFQPPPMIPPQYQQPIPMPVQFPVPIPQPASNVTPQFPDVAQQVQSFLASYQNGGNGAAPAQSFDFNAWAAQNSGQSETQGYGAQNQQPRWEGNWGNENQNPTSNSNQNGNRPRDNPNPKKKQRTYDSQPNDSLFDASGEYKGKKKPCRFYQEGKCAKGAKCTYLHD